MSPTLPSVGKQRLLCARASLAVAGLVVLWIAESVVVIGSTAKFASVATGWDEEDFSADDGGRSL